MLIFLTIAFWAVACAVGYHAMRWAIFARLPEDRCNNKKTARTYAWMTVAPELIALMGLLGAFWLLVALVM